MSKVEDLLKEAEAPRCPFGEIEDKEAAKFLAGLVEMYALYAEDNTRRKPSPAQATLILKREWGIIVNDHRQLSAHIRGACKCQKT